MTEPLLEEEMIDRLNAGEDPIDLSIEKYERLLKIAESDEEIDEWWIMSGCCPLCHEYECCPTEIDEDNLQCPLELYADCCLESGSAWQWVRYSIDRGNSEEIIIAIKNMIDVLKYIKQRMMEGD